MSNLHQSMLTHTPTKARTCRHLKGESGTNLIWICFIEQDDDAIDREEFDFLLPVQKHECFIAAYADGIVKVQYFKKFKTIIHSIDTFNSASVQNIWNTMKILVGSDTEKINLKKIEQLIEVIENQVAIFKHQMELGDDFNARETKLIERENKFNQEKTKHMVIMTKKRKIVDDMTCLYEDNAKRVKMRLDKLDKDEEDNNKRIIELQKENNELRSKLN
jgi:hypothetical protein